MRCLEKACPAPAAADSEYCRAHQKAPLTKLPPPVQVESDFEIVDMATVPTFKVVNERSYKIAKAISVLGPGKELRVRIDSKKGQSSINSIGNYCSKFGFKAHHRCSPGFVFF